MSLSPPAAPARVEPPPDPRPRRATRSFRYARADVRYSPYLFIAPFFAVFAVFGLYPMLRTLWMSLHDWDFTNRYAPQPFVGLDNYQALLADPYFWNALGNTFGIFVLATVPQLALALWVATLLNRPLRARTFFRMSILVPNVTSVAAVGIVFGTLFQRDFGVVNWLLSLVGVDAIDWRNEQWASWTAIAAMVDWRWTGYNALIFLAGMQAIPRDLYEAAALDGANARRQFWTVTLPMLRPTFIFAVIMATIGGIQLFTEPLIFAGNILGGNTRQFQTIAMYMFERGIDNSNTAGYGAAIAWAIFVIIIVVSLLNVLVVRRSVRGDSR